MLGLKSAKLAKASVLFDSGAESTPPNGSLPQSGSETGFEASSCGKLGLRLPPFMPGAGGLGGGAFFCFGGSAGMGEGPGRGGAGLFPLA